MSNGFNFMNAQRTNFFLASDDNDNASKLITMDRTQIPFKT